MASGVIIVPKFRRREESSGINWLVCKTNPCLTSSLQPNLFRESWAFGMLSLNSVMIHELALQGSTEFWFLKLPSDYVIGNDCIPP